MLTAFVLLVSTSTNLVATAFTTTSTHSVTNRNHIGPLFGAIAESPVVLEEKEDTEVENTSSATSDDDDSTASIQTDMKAVDDDEFEMSIFDIVSARAALCLYESEMKRDAKVNDVITPSTATNWINDASAYALQKAIDKLKIKVRKVVSLYPNVRHAFVFFTSHVCFISVAHSFPRRGLVLIGMKHPPG